MKKGKRKPRPKPARPAFTPAEAAEKLKRSKLKKATSQATAKYDIGGVEKTHRYRRKPVTLPSPRTMRELFKDEE